MCTVISTLSHAYNDFYKKQWYIVMFTLNAEPGKWKSSYLQRGPKPKMRVGLKTWKMCKFHLQAGMVGMPVLWSRRYFVASTLSSSRFGHVRSLLMKRERERSPLFIESVTVCHIYRHIYGTDCHIYRHCSLWHRHRLPHLSLMFTVAQSQTATFIAIVHCDRHRLPHFLPLFTVAHLSPLFTVAQAQTATFIATVHCGTGTDCQMQCSRPCLSDYQTSISTSDRAQKMLWVYFSFQSQLIPFKLQQSFEAKFCLNWTKDIF